jgi:thiamine kinase-like enzyme
MIPENKQPAVKKALHAAFGANEFESVQQLTKGLSSALIFKIIVRGKPYLLRVITSTDAMGDPAFYFNCMTIADDAAIGPRIHYLNIEDRISITDFIEPHHFPITEAREKMPDLLKRLHTLPKFPFRMNYFEKMEGFLSKFKAANILPASVTKDVFELYARVANVYPRYDQENWVSCHNDVKPENILFDGTRPWLVDWEAAFLNDRYLDLAIVANFVVMNDNDEANYLERYFGRTADEYEHARFFLMRQLLHTYYFIFFMFFGAEGKPVDPNMDKPDFRDFHDGIWNDEISLVNSDVKVKYAWVHMEQFLYNSRMKRFEESLNIVSKYHVVNSIL